MDSTNTIIGVVITLCCGIPFFLIYLSKKKKTQQKKLLFKTIAKENNLIINTIEVFNHLTFGIDISKKIALITNNNSYNVINLNQCENAYLDVHKKRINKSTELITDVFLGIKTPDKQNTSYNIFNEDINRIIDGEVEVGKKWINTINQVINK